MDTFAVGELGDVRFLTAVLCHQARLNGIGIVHSLRYQCLRGTPTDP